ncbi:MAG TPA: oligosaccharide flippase family protein [Niabella sp.]|nr:oligosaccharide flippase family protein [Niabella sp.]
MNISKLRKSPIVTNFISLASVQGINFLLPIITIPYLFRVLGVEKYGLFNFGYAFVQYFIIFTDFGFSLSATKYISIHREDSRKVNEYLNAVLFAGMLIVLLGFLVVLCVAFFIPKFSNDKTFFLLFYGMVLGNALFPSWFFQGIEKMKYITIINITIKIISIIPIFFFVHGPSDYIALPVFYSAGFLIAGCISLYFVYFRMGMKFFIPKIKMIWWSLKDSSAYFLSRASLSLFTTSNTFILGLAVNNTAVGYYAAAEKIYEAINAICYPLSGTLFPYMSKNKNVKFFKKIFFGAISVNTIIVTCLLILAPFVISILFKTDSLYSVQVLRILGFAAFITVPSILLGYPFLAAMGHSNFTNGTVVVASCTHILGLLFLYFTNSITIYTIAWMVVISQTLLFIFRVYGVKKYKLL